MSPAMIEAMRQWAADCVWADSIDGDPSFLEELTADEIVRGIARHYEGGIAQFVLDATPAERGQQ